ncbi:endoribonuclease L-PSP [Cryptococcus gattii E566]|uniref:Endoribonuclease L-PSP n=1 Tax=Cryptococcus gattii EJB2 TaxID=1296103 RepID=A0ABR5C5B3_9TREE|nr:endoribonuclease L-PSP [Cryptococcus gattii EJB2]KIY32242.1 endoribonuclease L-PSP [Cryptococcus gattii E566]KJE04754.1 endoribonuclease L-PSP [Cryptococcus gattii NT-10]
MSGLQYFNYKDYGTEKAEKEFGYSQAVRVGDTIQCSGQGGWDPETGDFPKTKEINAQIDQAFRNVDLALKAAGSKGWEQVCRSDVHVLGPHLRSSYCNRSTALTHTTFLSTMRARKPWVKGGWNIGGGQDVDSRKRLKVIFVLGMRTKRKWDEMFGNRTGRPQEADIHDGRRNTLGLSTSRPNGFRISNNSKMSETNFIRTLTVFQFTVGLL